MLDVGGVSLRIVKVMPLFKEVNRIGSSYFPERTVHILVLNAPRIFSSLWSMVRAAHACVPCLCCHVGNSRPPALRLQIKPLVDPRTQKKVHILSGGEHQLKGAACFGARSFQVDSHHAHCLAHAVQNDSATHLPRGCRHTAQPRRRARAAVHQRPRCTSDGLNVRLHTALLFAHASL